jgi:hypothetical protein
VTAPDAKPVPASNATAPVTTIGKPYAPRVGGLPEWLRDDAPYIIRGLIHELIGHPKKDVIQEKSSWGTNKRYCRSCLGYVS